MLLDTPSSCVSWAAMPVAAMWRERNTPGHLATRVPAAVDFRFSLRLKRFLAVLVHSWYELEPKASTHGRASVKKPALGRRSIASVAARETAVGRVVR